MFRRNKLFFWTAEILLLTLIFYLWREMGAIITPFVTVVNTIMIPFLLGGFFYYITNPVLLLLYGNMNSNFFLLGDSIFIKKIRFP